MGNLAPWPAASPHCRLLRSSLPAHSIMMNTSGDSFPLQVSVWACQWVTFTLLQPANIAQLKAGFCCANPVFTPHSPAYASSANGALSPRREAVTRLASLVAQASLLKQMGLTLPSEDVIMRHERPCA